MAIQVVSQPDPAKYNVVVDMGNGSFKFVACDTQAEAMADIQAHQNVGAILYQNAWIYGTSTFALSAGAPATNINPSSPPGASTAAAAYVGSPCAGNGDFLGASATRTSTGWQVTARTSHQQGGEAMTFAVYAVVNGAELGPIYTTPSLPTPSNHYDATHIFDLDAATLTQAATAMGMPATVIASGAALRLKGMWPNGHDQGAGGAGGGGGGFNLP